MDIFTKETINGNMEIINSLTREHCRYMEEKRTFKRSDIMKMDMIDLRGAVEYSRSGLGTVDKNAALPANMHTLITDDFIRTVGRYAYLPCFTTGSLRLNLNRFIYFNVEEIEAEDHFTVFVKDYFRLNDIWQGGTEIKVRIDLQKKNMIYDDILNETDILYQKGFCELYTDIPAGWKNNEIFLWNSLAVNHAQNMRKERAKKWGSEFTDLLSIFLTATALSNQILAANKPKAVRSKNSNRNTERKIVADEQKETPKRIVRNVGPIQIKSEKIPKVPTKDTVIHYKVASWKARGGLRHYKNGKVVPFKPCVKHRQCLKSNDEQTDIPVTIKLHTLPGVNNQ